MLHYTILSQEILTRGADRIGIPIMVCCRGRILYGEYTDRGLFLCRCLVSTDPADYLNRAYSPGSVLKV